MRTHLSTSEINACIEFSMKCSAGMYGHEFGERRGNIRSPKEIARDNLIGKMGEVAFTKCMIHFGERIESDFDLYPKGIGDDTDFMMHGQRTDVKATRSRGRYLLIDSNQLYAKARMDRLPLVVVGAIVGWNREEDAPENWVDVKGFSFLSDICSVTEVGGKIVLKPTGSEFIRKGGFIPGTSTRLQASNFVLDMKKLNPNFAQLVENLKTSF